MYKKILFLSFLFCSYLFIGSNIVFAAEDTEQEKFKLQVEIPNLVISTPDGTGKSIKEYISGFYTVAIGLTGILATVMIALGGMTWLTAGGSSTQIGKAKQMIIGSLTGLVLAFSSYMILYIVNPDIVNLAFPDKAIVSIKGVNRGCSWQKMECDDSFQEEQQGYDLELCGEKTGDYCCCTAKDVSMAVVRSSKECIKYGNDYFISGSGFISGSSEFDNDVVSLSVELKKECADACSGKKGLADFHEIIEGGQRFGCCSCDSDKGGLSGEVKCNDDTDCKGLFFKKGGGSLDYTCWKNDHTCKPCKKEGSKCSGIFNNYECCNGDCMDADGVGTGNICN